MAGIAGLARPGRQQEVVQMLDKMSHRGKDRAKMLEKRNVTMQAAWPEIQSRPTPLSLQMNAVWDGVSAPIPDPVSLSNHAEPFALAAFSPQGLFLARDPLGVKPLYYGVYDDALAFASEVKALLLLTDDVREFPPGAWYTSQSGFKQFATLKSGKLPYRAVVEVEAVDVYVGEHGLSLNTETAVRRSRTGFANYYRGVASIIVKSADLSSVKSVITHILAQPDSAD